MITKHGPKYDYMITKHGPKYDCMITKHDPKYDCMITKHGPKYQAAAIFSDLNSVRLDLTLLPLCKWDMLFCGGILRP